METVEKPKTLELLLICPRCGNNFVWTSTDFEDWATCPVCEYGNEAWFFWHTTYPVAVLDYDIKGIRYEVFSFGAHYTNNAPTLTREEFIEQLTWRYKGLVHGGGPYMWITRWWYGHDNPNNGHLECKVVTDYIYIYEEPKREEIAHIFNEIADILLTGLMAVKNLPRGF